MASQGNIIAYFFVAVILPLIYSSQDHISSAQVQFVNLPPSSKVTNTSDSISTTRPRCGENYVTHSGGVFYKPFEQVLEHERCVWVINVPNALGYSINVQFMSAPTNQPASGQGLVLTGFTWNNTEPLIMSNYLPTTPGEFNISDTNVVVVTFFSSEQVEGSQNTGFVIEYEALYEGNATAIAASSTGHIVESPHFYLRYAPNGSTYQSRQLMTYIFPPSNHIRSSNILTIHYMRNALEGQTCNDSLFVYKFNASSTSLETFWENAGRICGNVTDRIITHDDVSVVLFQSNSAATNYAGYWLSLVSC